MVRTVKKLYDICIDVAVADCITACQFCKKEFRYLPNNVLFDFYHKMFLEKRLCLLAVEFSDLDVFNRVLSVKHQRTKFLKCFQSLIEHGTHIPEEIIKSYLYYCKNADLLDVSVIETGLRIGGFFNEGGLYRCSIEILNITEEICKTRIRDVTTLRMLLDCYHKRIYAESVYCEFDQAAETFKSAQEVVRQLELFNYVPNLAGLYSNYSFLYFLRSEYDEAFTWSQRALKLLNEDLSPRIIIEVLRQASKSCVVKRKFNPAGLLIGQAVILASNLFEIDNHPHFSDTLLDYGFYLLHYDSIQESVKMYERALAIRKDMFQKNNIHIALGHEDLAYALYVNEYSSGRFYKAKENAERSIRIMERILPKDHLLLASVKRVKALILEEIALDEQNDVEIHNSYLQEAEQLHKAALELSFKSFGEKNVQTAKHYGNLGRLYQSMKKYEEAERMHLRAIAIKEELLGSDDYEVGLSTGHLASLYNYHMKRHKDAEQLYLRSIKINLKLFGDAYSGLEYDYRGLINVYSKLMDAQMALHYSYKMAEWKSLREKVKPALHTNKLLPLGELVNEYFCLCE
ncbi:protein interacting with APP tail-1 [Leptinotarsa decemlineata]|uniref:protein interacting with APP tail-1 n=1 Tax=Leptinotarsa decemlineata TaxID=7539 RepID=UPI000C252528|nr:amyloid protein-binding protein 2 [Leptinotarsa decemlineata]